MKRLMLAAMLFLIGGPSAQAHGDFSVSFGVFYSSLSPHGEWIALDAGLYAWRPLHVVHGWRPYTVGHWIWTDEGWYWISDEPWGWATYHYGRWYYDDYYGWIWIPGYEWAPAWVEWRYGYDCIGWAPLGPYAVFTVNFGLYRPHWWVTPSFYWVFVEPGYITHHHVHKYVYKASDNKRYLGRTRTIGSVRSGGGHIVSNGPDPRDIERSGKIRIQKTEIVEVKDQPVERVKSSRDRVAKVEVYRPRIQQPEGGRNNERPKRVVEPRKKISIDVKALDMPGRKHQQPVEEKRGEQKPKGKESSKKNTAQPELGRKKTPPSIEADAHDRGPGRSVGDHPLAAESRGTNGKTVDRTPAGKQPSKSEQATVSQRVDTGRTPRPTVPTERGAVRRDPDDR
jgi:hypothetical protein